ncbi:NAD(P)/FAD-dependent oxidoreductase [[Flexibacter] sp. ATCC 35208]|uniref:NAD(P)/FAD-dependent oxidoreductase n=1 Tax=[Flexibacter] sp. ATCC 35208 TaxID=1936242 RepID=UPI0009D4A887|nr:NAD(P)/FAD-dependent oxidoreductase [[Flexibacter] sp. ATCC 35208]OMP76568.1 FAD-dependent oxidoreductase [[Flexibacter] sp. ATCC 35208]
MEHTHKKVVIIGGGFAGLNLAKNLVKTPGYHITLIDRNNYNFFQPLLYQVATGFLEVSSISYPYRKLLQGKKNIHFCLGRLVEILPVENKVLLDVGEMEYDYLVLATGTKSNYLNLKNIEANALPMKTLDDAINMRNYLLQQIETASRVTDIAAKKKLTTIVIVGGGPTGIEIAGMLAEMTKSILPKDYPELNDHAGGIYLVDSHHSLLSSMSERSQAYTYNKLQDMGVRIMLGARVMDYVDDMLMLSTGEIIPAKILIWAAGVTGEVFPGIPQSSYGNGNRLRVDAHNTVNAFSNIFAIGDIALQTSDPNYSNGHPQVAQVAIQQGKSLAYNLMAINSNKPLKPFTYFDKGSMAIIGSKKAVADMPKQRIHFNGFIAWVMWLFIHLTYLTNHRNRVKTFYNWMLAYFTKDQVLRMIIRPSSRA